MTDETSDKIVEAAMEEFSETGYGGARVARIAARAGVNKALLFYYYRSKEKLYAAVMETVMGRVLSPILDFLDKVETADEFINGFPALHIRFVAKNQRLMRIGVGHFIGTPGGLSPEAVNALRATIGKIKNSVLHKVENWIKTGQIRSEDPLHFIINIVSLNAFCFLARPFFEAIIGFRYDDDPDFTQKRIQSVTALLGGGLRP